MSFVHLFYNVFVQVVMSPTQSARTLGLLPRHFSPLPARSFSSLVLKR